MDQLSQYTREVARDESRRRSIGELQGDLLWRPNLPKTCTVADAHKACLELLERQLAVVIECAKEGNSGVKSLLNPIARRLDDQIVRFEIWSSDVDAKTGTLGEEPVTGAFSGEMNNLFGLVKDRLLKILELAGIVSDDLGTVFGVLGSIDNGSDRSTASQRLQDSCDHVSTTISEIDPVLKNLGTLVRPVRAAQAAFRQEGSYWEHRQKILQVKNAGRSAGPSGLPSPSPSRASDESPSSASYPDRNARVEFFSEGSDKGKGPEVTTRSIAIVQDNSTHPTLTGRAMGKTRLATRSQQSRSPPDGGQISIACPTDRLKARLDMVVENHFHDEDWMHTVDDRIQSVLDEDSLKALFTCVCTKCRLSRRLAIASSSSNGEGLQLEGVPDALRLLSMCILAEKPFLISLLLSRDIDDEVFEDCKSETQLVDATGIALDDARTLLKLKGLFFGVSMMRYLRSPKQDDKPQDGERTWLLNEILELTRKLSTPNDTSELDLQSMMISQLTFTKTKRMDTDRLNDVFPELWDDDVSIQSLGFLVMDMIWFLVGGSSMVMYMDALRSKPTSRPAGPFDWIKAISREAFAQLEAEPELAQAFEVAYILIQPNGRFGLDGTPEENYAYADMHLRKLWPVSFLDDPFRVGGHRSNRSLDAWSVSTKASTEADSNYIEMEGSVFKWLILRYRKDGEGDVDSGCRIRIYKSPNGQRLRFVVCDFDKDPNKHTSFQVLTEGLCFVPLYSYDERPTEFSAKLQPKSGSTRDINIQYIFTFQTREDVQLLQECLTGRTIESHAILNSFSLLVKKHRGFEIRGVEIGFWDSKRQEIQATNFGAMQIWRVLEKDKLDSVHKGDQQQKRGVKEHPLRFEIAVTSDKMLLVIGVRSLLRVRDVDSLGLSITSRDDARASSLIGRLYQAQKLDDETIFPGIPVFQKPPFESPQDGEMILCSALRLGFSSKLARDSIRRFLVKSYNAKPC
ncbi:hypothetical protein ONS95_013781 [Cadophora gregata]|uniref:uncharacterized protein n=1 Tax=Cadophora gregata TaxID=51156 RepID=UPI0026DDAF7C|nr:uncharacterized protein ONS95_013781 [Cadophora gregata]KAK0114286.1 hypothetical protein ONS95_013781 [Cadophora gregata]